MISNDIDSNYTSNNTIIIEEKYNMYIIIGVYVYIYIYIYIYIYTRHGFTGRRKPPSRQAATRDMTGADGSPANRALEIAL